MTPKNVLGAFEKTGITPLNPSKVLTKVTLEDVPNLQRPSISRSSSSALSESDIQNIRVMFSDLNINSQRKHAKTIANSHSTMVSLRTELAIIKAQLCPQI